MALAHLRVALYLYRNTLWSHHGVIRGGGGVGWIFVLNKDAIWITYNHKRGRRSAGAGDES